MRGPSGRTTMMIMTMFVTIVKTKIAQREKNTKRKKKIITTTSTTTTCSVTRVYI